LTAISPRFGPVTGDTLVTFTGEGFSAVPEENSVIIDGVACAVQESDTTFVKCLTDDRYGLVKSSLEIYVNGKGLTAL
jgi:hypothetical protein